MLKSMVKQDKYQEIKTHQEVKKQNPYDIGEGNDRAMWDQGALAQGMAS